jgi:polysaccharide chain length determinant protein (PEP-CTERM system associated)
MPEDMISPAHDESLALRVIEIIRRRRILAAAVFSTVLASAVSFALYLPDLFQSSAVVLVERQISESFVRPAVSGELESRLHVIKQEILSRARLTELIQRFDLYPERRQRQSMESVLDQMRKDILVESIGPEQVNTRTKTVAFQLTYTGRDREKVSEVTNAMAAFYVAQNDRIRSREAMQTTVFLKAQLDEAKRALLKGEATMRAFTTTNIGSLPQQVSVNLATLERLNTQLRLNGEQQLRILEQREKILEDIPDILAPRVPGEPDRPVGWIDKMRRIESMKRDLESLETRFTSRHPDVVRLREQLAILEKEAAEQATEPAEPTAAEALKVPDPLRGAPQARRRTVEALDAELEKLRKDEAGTRQSITNFERRVESAPERQQEFMLISRDYQAAKDLYDSLLKKYEEAQLAESLETDRQGERFRLLETAVPPEGPAAPNRLRLLLMGLLLAAAAAAAVVLGAEQLDMSFHNVDEVREFTRVPVLVSIPRIPASRAHRAMRAVLATASLVGVVALAAGLSAHFASGNEQLVRLLVRTG